MRTRTAQICIDHEALRHNFQRVKSLAGDSKVIAVIKANAYGHGVQAAADVFSQADAFALATAGEAIALRQSGVTRPLVALQGCFDSEELKTLSELNIQTVVHQP
ncbi:alanine racemase, partial [Marinospirillum sp.]|uniref:alanine racemase n=1 Tax=Marinospirillum sp. TaxID=2183934 RepID=UPI00286FCCFA